MTNRLFLIPLLSLVIANSVTAQAAQPAAQGWTGWAQCKLTIQAPGYEHSETHLWKVAGGPTKQGNMEISPMTWTVVGNGSLQRASGPTTTTAQWTVSGTLPNVTIGATNHLDRITLQRWTNHGPARSALTGTEVTTINGVPRSRAVILDVQQWAFPFSETGTTSTRAAGSNTLPFDGLRGPMNPPSGATGTAACTWDFARGTTSPSAAPALATPTTTTSSTTTTAPTSTTSTPSTNTTPSTNAAELATTFFGPMDPSGLTIPTSWQANGNAMYGLGVVNQGPGAADGATITIPASVGLTKTGVSCTFQRDPQAATPFIPLNPTVSQIESGFVIPTLPSGGYVNCRIQATVTATAGSNVTLNLSLAPPIGVSDPTPANNPATSTLPIR
jgi:hypothetical protein